MCHTQSLRLNIKDNNNTNIKHKKLIKLMKKSKQTNEIKYTN